MKALDFGTGALSEITERIYWYLVTGVLFILVTLPGSIPLLFLERHSSNAPLYALFLTVMVPAWSASCFALTQRHVAEAVTPVKYFFRGYRLNWLASLKVWAPIVALLTILAINLSNLEATGFGSWYLIVGLLLMLSLLVWAVEALVIVSLLSFRTSDVVRLTSGYLLSMPIVTLGLAGVVVLCGLVVLVTFDAVLLLLMPVWTGLVLRVSQPLLSDLRARFTVAPSPEAAPGDPHPTH